MKKIVLVLVLVFSVGFAEIKGNKSSTLICKSNNTVGLNWDNEKWNPIKFNNTSYIVEKFKIEKPTLLENGKRTLGRSGLCWDEYNDKIKSLRSKLGKFEQGYGCYNIRLNNEKFYSWTNELCLEVWDKNELKTITCKDSSLNIFNNKKFIHATIKNGHADGMGSIYVEEGKCTIK